MMLPESTLIRPDWPAPKNVQAFMTTRRGGVSSSPYESLNLGDHVNDDSLNVEENRSRVAGHLPSEPLWLSQVHGVNVVTVEDCEHNCAADASVTGQVNQVSCVMTADCLPVLFCDRQGTKVASAHAGWRGLCNGVLEATLLKFEDPASVLIWFGAAIGPTAFEVGEEVKAAFEEKQPQASFSHCFISSSRPNKYLADIYQLARLKLEAAGVKAEHIYGGDCCTFSDEERFFSFRRDGQTGRMVSCIWMQG